MSTITMDPVPSTDDVPAFPEDDPVRATLLAARARYERGAVDHLYWGGTEVCAVGAVFAAEYGQRNALWERVQADHPHIAFAYDNPEQYLSETACEAIVCLDAAAAVLYPEISPFRRCLGGRIEGVNEYTFRRPERAGFDFKAAVLRCYDHALAER